MFNHDRIQGQYCMINHGQNTLRNMINHGQHTGTIQYA